MIMPENRIYRLLIIIITLFTISMHCTYSRDLETIKNSGKIYIGMTKEDIENINYPLALEFSKYLNVEVEIVEISWEEAFMKNGTIPEDVETDPSIIYNPDIFKKVDIICSTISTLEWRKKLFDFARTLESSEMLLTVQTENPLQDYSDLKGKTIGLVGNTSFEEHISDINKRLDGGINVITTKSSDESKQLLLEDRVFGIVLDADEALLFNSEHDQEYDISLPVSPVKKTAWAVEKGNNLKKEVEAFFRTIKNNGVLDKIFIDKFDISHSNYLQKINKVVILRRYHRDLDKILEDGKLVVALRDRKFVYQKGGPKQPMHALAEEFANSLGVSLEYVVTPYFNKYWETANGETVKDSSYTPEWFNNFDIACEIFTKRPWRSKKVNFVPVYPSEYSIIARKDLDINSINDLGELKCVTSKGSSYEDFLINNKLENYYYESSDTFLEEIQSGKADYTILDNSFTKLSNYPELEFKISLGTNDICWGLRKDQPQLEAELRKFFSQSKQTGLIHVLITAIKKNYLQSPEAFVSSYYESYQEGQFPYVMYDAEDGLPQENIFTIFQDAEGYMWFGTNSGAVRYNGRNMKLITTGSEPGSNSIKDIAQDSTGRIYLATRKGITLCNCDTIGERLFSDTGFKKIFIDSKNNKWFIANDGVYLLSDNGSERFLNDEFPELPSDIYDIDESNNGLCSIISTSGGLFEYNPVNKTIKQVTDEPCYCAMINNNDSLWLATDKGLFVTHIDDVRNNKYNETKRQVIANPGNGRNKIKEIISDRFGFTWVVEDSRIIKIAPYDQDYAVYDRQVGLKDNEILAFTVDNEYNLWLGYKGGLQKLSNKNGLRNFYPGIINSHVYSILEAESGEIWISSNNGVYYFNEEPVNFTPGLDKEQNKYVMTGMPGNKILLASTKGLYEVDPERHYVTRKRIFDNELMNLDNIFLTTKGRIILIDGSNSILYLFDDFYSSPVKTNGKLSSDIYQLIEMDGQVMGGSANGIVILEDRQTKMLAETNYRVWSMYHDDNKLWLATEKGLGLVLNRDFDNIHLINPGNDLIIKSICPARNKNYLWLGTNKGFCYFNKKVNEIDFIVGSGDGMFGNEVTPSGLYMDSNDILWIGTYQGLSNFNIRARTSMLFYPECSLESVEVNDQLIAPEQNGVFRYNENNFVFEIAALSFTNENSIEYEFYLRGDANNFSSYQKGKEYRAGFTNVPPGNYEFMYRAKGSNEIWSYTNNYKFTILKAWYQTWIFRTAAVLITMLLIWLAYKWRVKTIEQQKRKLEKLVHIRTKELEAANEKIENQLELVEEQRDQISEQKKDITDSIYYAENIQRSLLPSEETLGSTFSEYFVLFKPRDIISGDFYWVKETESKIYLIAADCTGHGVPGALMSMLGISFLNEIVNKYKNIEVDEMLNQLRSYIIKALNQDDRDSESRDGMDISLVSIERNSNSLCFSGANNPLYFLRDNELTEVKGDKMPIGKDEVMLPFTKHEISTRQGDLFYMFSDGYPDQFGGPKDKKFKYPRFKRILKDISVKPMNEQRDILDRKIEEWKGDNEQTDDIIVLGFRLP